MIRVASFLLAFAVIMGAFGAHALKSRLTPESLTVWKTAVEYHFYHAFGLLLVFLLFKMNIISEKTSNRVSALLLSGIVFFSGSLYLLSTKSILGWDPSFLGPITPIGGVLFITGWVMLALKANVHSVKQP
jgi:uncharacterized membrane protein YgdD (TMEM256/DUF423 family)